MTGSWSIRRLLVVLGLAAVWCAYWGEVSVANVASGLLVGAVASTIGNEASGRRIRLVPMMRLLWVVFVDLVESTAVVVREVVTVVDDTDEAIIVVPIDSAGRNHLLLLYVAITLTPGTAVVAGSHDEEVLYLHILHADRRDAIEEHVALLVRLAERAFPTSAPMPHDAEVSS